VAHGKGCTVQLTTGNYLTKQLVAYNFRGAFKGKGKDLTIIEGLPNLPVNLSDKDNTTWWPPNTTDHTWPDLIMFVDGDIKVSDMTIKITAIPAVQTWWFAGLDWHAMLSALRFMGQYRTNATVERVAVEGTPDDTTRFYGVNLLNGVMYIGDLPKSNVFHDAFDLSGSFTVSSSSFKTVADATPAGGGAGVVKDSRITIGGAPGGGNVYSEDVAYGIDLASLGNSVVEVSYNVAAGYYFSSGVYQGGGAPNKPSLYIIHHNTFKPSGPNADGIFLMDDPSNKLIYALIYNNTIEAQDIGYGGISAYSTKDTTILNNKISGKGLDAIGIWDGTNASVLGNDVTNFTASPDLAQIVLDGTTTHSTVVCKLPNDTVQSQGTDNKLIGCQQVGASAKASTKTSHPQPMRSKPELQ
jgi:Right handed beta helix region